jgi:hypothetical protein
VSEHEGVVAGAEVDGLEADEVESSERVLRSRVWPAPVRLEGVVAGAAVDADGRRRR